MSKKILFTMLLTLVSTAAFAQESEESHNDVSFSVGAAVPRGADRAYLNNAPMISRVWVPVQPVLSGGRGPANGIWRCE